MNKDLVFSSSGSMWIRRAGFGLIEMLLVLALLGAVSGVSVPVYRQYRERSDLHLASESVVQGLERAQFLSRLGQGDTGWGYHVPSGTIFQGTNYATRDATFDEVQPLPSGVTVAGASEVSFSKIEGTPSVTGDIVFSGERGGSTSVAVGSDGVIINENDRLTICHRPPGNPENMHTLTIAQHAWPSHESHGDTVGPCDDDDDGDDDDDDDGDDD